MEKGATRPDLHIRDDSEASTLHASPRTHTHHIHTLVPTTTTPPPPPPRLADTYNTKLGQPDDKVISSGRSVGRLAGRPRGRQELCREIRRREAIWAPGRRRARWSVDVLRLGWGVTVTQTTSTSVQFLVNVFNSCLTCTRTCILLCTCGCFNLYLLSKQPALPCC